MADLKTLKLVCIWGHPKDARYEYNGRCPTCAKKRSHKKRQAKLERDRLNT